jgi:hypothetical protein
MQRPCKDDRATGAKHYYATNLNKYKKRNINEEDEY